MHISFLHKIYTFRFSGYVHFVFPDICSSDKMFLPLKKVTVVFKKTLDVFEKTLDVF